MFIYLLFKDLNPATAGTARINAKEREEKEKQVNRAKKREGIEVEGETPNPIQGN